MKFKIKIDQYKSIIILSFLSIFIIKFYYLIINQVDHGIVTSYSANTLIYYNAKSFLLSWQSFNDWNHPGTPIYYFVYLISLIINGLHIDNFDNFVLSHNILTFILTIFSIGYFVKFFKRYLRPYEILIILLFSNSFYMSIHTLEFIDPTNYLLPFGYLMLVETIKLLKEPQKNKRFISFAFIAALSLSTKLTFIPFFISSCVAITYSLFFEYRVKAIKNTIKLFSYFIIFFLLWNFPIIGRLPRIIYHVLFIRDDTSFQFNNIFEILEDLILFFKDFNLFILGLLFLFSFLIIINILKYFYLLIAYKNELKPKSLNIFFFLLCASFAYTLLCTQVELELFRNEIGIGDSLRNSYLYSLFICPLLLSKKFEYKFFKIFTLTLVIFSFIYNLNSYNTNRERAKSELQNRNQILMNKIGFIFQGNSKVAMFNGGGYPFSNAVMHHIGNNVFAGERFTNELNKKYKNIRYLRVIDIIDNYRNKNSNKNESVNYPNKKIKYLYDKIDNFLKKNFHPQLYLILSHKSFRETSNFAGFKNRSKEFFIKDKSDKINYILFNYSNLFFKKEKITSEEFIKILKEKIDFKQEDIDIFQVKNDTWYLISLN
jgi:hypothetical protein